MNENENDVLGFDPTQLSVFNENNAPKSQGNPLIYRTRPADSKSEDGIYRATIKVIYNPFDLKHSVLEQQSYWLTDKDGGFSAISSLTVNDTNCPIFKAWKKCHFAKQRDGSFKTPFDKVLWLQSANKTDDPDGKALFDKRFARYVTIQVLEDKNQPDLVGQYMFWKLPKAVWDIINAKMNPSKESGKAPIPVMDFLFGRSIDIEVTPGPGNVGDERYSRETKYMAELSEDVVSCTNPDGSPLLNDAETTVFDTYVSQMSKVWKTKDTESRSTLLAEVNADANTSEFRKIYSKVLEQIKSFCPNVIESLGYKEWDENLTKRVNDWIDVVLTGNDPAVKIPVTPSTPTTTTSTPSETKAPEAITTAPPFTEGDSADDLPF